MLKYSDNLILESAGGGKVKVTQSKDGCDFITYLEGVKYTGLSKVCLQTDRFILVESEGLRGVNIGVTSVELETGDGVYTLPVMRERGTFLVDPPVVLPSTDPEVVWEYDFSGKAINTSSAEGLGLASALVVIGDNLTARSISNVMEMYGDSSTARFALSPKQFSLATKAGKSKVTYWSTGEALITGEKGIEVAIKSTKSKLDIASLETRLTSTQKILEADLSSLKVKTFGKFVVEKLILNFTNGKATFITDSARKTIECPGLEVTEPLALEIMLKDLKHLVGKISITTMEAKGQTRYVIRTSDKDKVVYVLVAKATLPQTV